MTKREKPAISVQAVLAATGRTWEEWFNYIHNHNGMGKNHKEIVALIADGFPGVDEWWQQSITVEYEHTHGKRKKHETADGFQISKSITIPVTIQQMYQAWVDENIRRQWLPDPDFTVRKATEIKSMRITWVDGVTHVDVYFYEKKSGSQVTINHKKITDSETASAMKAYWEKAFQSLKINLTE